MKRSARRRPPPAHELARGASLLDLVDNLLGKGVCLQGEVVIALADVDLVYLRVSAILAAADRVLPRSRA